jgi:hypothetical protein
MFTEQQLAQLKELISSQLGAVVETVTKQQNEGLSGLAARLVQTEMPKLIQTQIAPLQEKLGSFDADKLGGVVSTQLEALLDRIAREEEEAGSKPPSESEAAIAEMRAQLEAMQEEVKTARSTVENERKSREDMAKEARLLKLDEPILDNLRQFVRQGTERELLDNMKRAKILHEDGDQFKLEGTDNLGFKTLIPATDGLQQLVEQRWSHYLPPRPGTGTGGTPASPAPAGTPTTSPLLKQGQDGLTLDRDAMQQAARTGNLDTLLAQLDGVV